MEPNPNTDPSIHQVDLLMTWGKASQKRAPKESQRNWAVSNISIKDYGLNLKKINGKNRDLQSKINCDPKFMQLIELMVKEINENKYETISISCDKGKHRSVAIAEILKKLYYPRAEIIHLDL